eukprot:TRINITY_DN14563_c0_g1_i1.p2 TRINITY_DN14563_c0_g1~~TRINITY_DN14563_c0_g1_i1.p2  ORF type:complete len:239 (+),score=63.61 TRINITY_DN14563_c0_g1_i1:63-779(+)
MPSPRHRHVDVADATLARRLQAQEYMSGPPPRTERRGNPVTDALRAGVPGSEVAMQRDISRRIRHSNVQANLERAVEEAPETLVRVPLLHVSARLGQDGAVLPAVVDTGAQTSVISPEAAVRCGLDRLVDSRYRGAAVGVGAATITGRVHITDVTLGDAVCVSTSLSILDVGIPLLLGLDLLEKHRCLIDLAGRALVFSGARGRDGAAKRICVPFLSEREVGRLADSAGVRLRPRSAV